MDNIKTALNLSLKNKCKTIFTSPSFSHTWTKCTKVLLRKAQIIFLKTAETSLSKLQVF